MTDTLLYAPDGAVDATLISPGSSSGNTLGSASPASPPLTTSLRTTVLPHVEWRGEQPHVRPQERERFEELSALGQGGMGEVILLKDHDIERTVALKRLPEAAELGHVLRFVEEIRTVGQLDHPNIVPVHDVGVDAKGRYYFLMKHLQGETLEAIIEKLREGDAATHERFTHPVRMQIFLGVLNALAYAHRKGFIHRDLKPANIMVGPFGEVTVMDWGLARRLQARPHSGTNPASSDDTPQGPEETARRTRQGTIMGTPLYMSPEQARGQHDAVDVRSDTYSLCVLFHEFLFLRHYLHDRKSVAEVLDGVQNHTPSVFDHGTRSPHQLPVPSEFIWFIRKGLAKDPAERYQSVEEMIQELRGLMDGRIHVQCVRTFTKRGLHEALRKVESHPGFFLAMAGLVMTLVCAGLFHLVALLFG
ncbi:serine/threonine-protein kinase [Cystobacter ferrugineus]|uniref:Protein kinase n=1 Tax=Cystobacter ferrugineus TaxID=83449 RepID=A0A1L9BC91_9BACT|nr:serine/threonine-protein kinase [Cystobacter ferrugineus]OJH39882.1 protein kinase [Cystobacter ferrugineus]